ncbi:MAG: hypothetical protein N2Z58_04620 [Fervidobacterium sp.]|nr:hypothetical protein [Fervidobacterium sp.]
MKRVTIVIFLLAIFSIVQAGVLHFEHADIVYPEGYLDIAVKIGNIFESVRSDVINLIGYDPGRITIILQDKGTISNGYTQVLLHKSIVLYVWPPEGYTYFHLPLEDWYTYLIIHEFTHMCHLSYQDELAKFISLITGLPYLPQLSSPFIEGTTVFAESSFSLSSGRLNNPFFSNGLYYYSLPNFPSFSYKEIVPYDDYRGGLLYYNFTAGFYKYLVDTYGLEKMKKFIAKTSETVPLILNPDKEVVDPYEFAFGKKFDELYTDWIMYLTKLDYSQGKLIYQLRNSYIMRVDSVGRDLSILRQSFGAATSYVGSFENGVLFIDDLNLKVVKDLPLNANDVRYDGGKIYALVPSLSFDKYENKIWDVTRNKLVASGYITSFGVKNGQIYVSYYDTKKLKSKIKQINGEFEYTFDGYIRAMDVSNDYIVFLTIDNKIVVLDKNANEVAFIKDRNMKGPFVKIDGKRILFSRVEGNYVIPYYYNLDNNKFYKLASKTLLSDFTIHKDELYYVSYVPYGKTGGMGIYKQKIELEELDKLPNESPISNISIKQHNYEKGDELAFRFGTFLRPVTWAPMYTSQVQENESIIHNLYIIFTFSNVENDTFVALTPILDVYQSTPNSFDFTILGFRQFVGFVTLKDFWGLSASYIYPTNDYSLLGELTLGSFDISPSTSVYLRSGINFKSSKDYTLDNVFSLIGGLDVPYIDSKTVSFGILTFTNLFSRPVRIANWIVSSNDKFDQLLTPNSFYTQNSLLFALNNDTSFLALTTTKLSDLSKTQYDVSLALTLFKDSAELFGGQVLLKNSGVTLGLANPGNIHGFYSQFFIETYLGSFKLYPSIGVFLQMMDLYGFQPPNFNGIIYFGIGSSPHLINIVSGIPF